jgi:hypothetical protein
MLEASGDFLFQIAKNLATLDWDHLLELRLNGFKAPAMRLHVNIMGNCVSSNG